MVSRSLALLRDLELSTRSAGRGGGGRLDAVRTACGGRSLKDDADDLTLELRRREDERDRAGADGEFARFGDGGRRCA